MVSTSQTVVETNGVIVAKNGKKSDNGKYCNFIVNTKHTEN